MRSRRRGRFGAWLCAVIAVGFTPSAGHADAQVALVVAPAGQPAERIAARVRELLAAASVTTSVRFDRDPADAPALAPGDGELALIAIDVSSSEQVFVRVHAANGYMLERTLRLPERAVDETACEEVAAVVASSIEALQANASAGPTGAASDALTRAPATGPKDEERAEAVSDIVTRAVTGAAEREHELGARGARSVAQWHALIGYETLRNGSHVVHGPRVALGYGVPSSAWRLGVRAEAFHAWSTRAESERLDVEVAATALRLLATFERGLGQSLGFELGAGVSAELAQLQAVSGPEDTRALRGRTDLSWAARVSAGARHAHRALLVAADVGLEFHPVKVEYGVQHPNGFVSAHAAARVRPGAMVSAGLQW